MSWFRHNNFNGEYYFTHSREPPGYLIGIIRTRPATEEEIKILEKED